MDKIYYGNSINLSGLYSKVPIKCDHVADYDKTTYWDESGNFEVNSNKLGTTKTDDCITFSSENENDVILWTEGVLATMKLLKRWCK